MTHYNMPQKLTHKWIWSQDYWIILADRIEMLYWKRIKKFLPNVPANKEQRAPSEHRLEEYVRGASRRMNIGNLHVGLTSSDLEDNIRLKRIMDNNNIIDKKLNKILQRIDRKDLKKINIKAKTHLLDAGITTVYARFAPSINLLMNVLFRVYYNKRYKGIGGSIGDNRVFKYITKGQYFDHSNTFMFPVQVDKHQTGDHLAELEFAQWIQSVSMTMGKICNDLRQMFAFGQAVHKSGDVASTAIVSKKTPNPWRYEKASAIFDELVFLPTHIARIGSHCLLERTLTNQSALNRLFERAYEDLELALDLFLEAWQKTEFIPDAPADYEDMELKLVDIIKEKKIGREEAYKILNNNIL